MRKHIVFASLSAIFVFGVFAAQSRVSAQISGGYGDLSVNNKDAKKAAAFAVKSRSLSTRRKIILVKILKAEVQVVAGLNYRVCLLVREGKGRSKSITAVVYRDLKKNLELSQWKPGGCTDL